MTIYVNEREVKLVTGMRVRHALIAAGLMDEIKKRRKIYDEMGNEIGLDGALSDGAKISVR